MTQAIKKKLRSNEGASLMVALLFFVMCATVGSIILTAATASSGRLAKIRQDDQTYYATSSAAELVVDQILNSSVKVVKTFSENAPETWQKPPTTFDGKRSSEIDNLLAYIVNESFLWDGNEIYTNKDPKEIKLEVTDYSNLNAKAKIGIEDNFDLVVTIFPADEKKKDINVIKLRFISAVNKNEEITDFDNEKTAERFTVKKTTYTISWKQVEIDRGN